MSRGRFCPVCAILAALLALAVVGAFAVLGSIVALIVWAFTHLQVIR